MHLHQIQHALKYIGYVWFPENAREKKLGEKMEGKEYNFFHLFGYPWKIQGKKKKNSFSFVWLTTKKSQGKMEGK